MWHDGSRGPPSTPTAETRLTRGRLLARNTVMSLLGQAAPVVIAILAVPHIIRGLGIDRYGVLTLAWLVVGYFSLFDFGLGWAVTRLVSEKLATEDDQEIPALVWTSMALLLAFGVVGALVVGLLSPWLVGHALRIPAALQDETLVAFYLLAASLPIVTSTAGLAGILAAQQRFDLINAVRFSMGGFSYLAPLVVLPFSRSLAAVVSVLVAGRLVAWLVHLLMCLRTLPALRRRLAVKRSLIVPLLGFGGWLTVTNVVGPLMVYFDRFLIGAMVSLASVAYYTTPYDLVTRLWLLSTPVVGVLFPAFAASFAGDRARTSRLFGHGVRFVFIVLFPCALLISTLAGEGLALWLGPEFARHSTRVLQLLAIGVFVNGLAQVAAALVQGIGRPDLSARLHLLELPLYVAGLWWLIRTHGIEGAAVAWLVRVTVDAAALFAMAQRLLGSGMERARGWVVAGLAALLLLAVSLAIDTLPIKILFLLMVLPAFVAVAWLKVVAPYWKSIAWRGAPPAGTVP